MSNSEVARFRQSLRDFPLTVALGSKTPSFGLHRYRQGLRFVPPDDEGFTLRGDRRRLLYKGRRVSHRFTILGDTAFEYDCILLREPDTNVITLLMEGAERYDFFRQPNFVKDPFLRGSYAVYKKDTFVGEGTGKLCHIHRPLIVDARGRRVWGDLSVAGNELRITIPEKWLAAAKYPVVVDPTIGTTTKGPFMNWINPHNKNYEQLIISNAIAVNRFLLTNTLRETARAYVYASIADCGVCCKPVVYSDNNNTPLTRISANEENIDVRIITGKPSGWRNIEFSIDTIIASGCYIWFGLMCDKFFPWYDYGNNCFMDSYTGNTVPQTYPLVNSNNYYDLKLSMYCDYYSQFNYNRKLTQGIGVTDSKQFSAEYKRELQQEVYGATGIQRIYSFIRQCVMNAGNSTDIIYGGEFLRGIADSAATLAETSRSGEWHKNIADKVKAEGTALRHLFIVLRILTTSLVRDYFIRRFFIVREELILKSCITRAITLESKMQ